MGSLKASFVWFVMTALLGTLLWWLNRNGVPLLIFNVDVTRVTSGIFVITMISNFWIGFLAWKCARDPKNWPKVRLWKHMRGIWFHVQQLFVLGIIGTTLGAMHLFYNHFGSVANIASATFSQLISGLLPPLGIVFATTGLAASGAWFLGEQLFLFTAIANLEDDDE